MDKGHRHRQPGEDIGFLRRDPAEIVQSRQTDMLDDKIKVGKISSRVINIPDIEGIGA